MFKTILIFTSFLIYSIGFCEETVITYYVPDASGSPIAAMDEQGNVKWRKHYKPFGEEIEQDAASEENRIGYTGHIHDRGTGLIYMGARYYDPTIGRFLSMDPIGVNPEAPSSFNRYTYANNNPYLYKDPDGKAPEWIFNPKAKMQGWSLRGVDAGYGPGMGANGKFATGRQFENRSFKQIVEDRNKQTAELFASLRKQNAEWKFGSHKKQSKWESQMKNRGWTNEQITEAIANGKTYEAKNLVNKDNSATRYVHPDTGKSVVRDDVTKEIIQVGGDGFKY